MHYKAELIKAQKLLKELQGSIVSLDDCGDAGRMVEDDAKKLNEYFATTELVEK